MHVRLPAGVERAAKDPTRSRMTDVRPARGPAFAHSFPAQSSLASVSGKGPWLASQHESEQPIEPEPSTDRPLLPRTSTHNDPSSEPKCPQTTQARYRTKATLLRLCTLHL